MKKRVLIISGIVLAVSGMSFMSPTSVLKVEGIMNSSGAAAGHTGSPSDGKTCTFCHGGTATAETGWITSDIPNDGYIPGQTYTITAMAQASGINKFGFQVSPQNANGDLLGTMTANSETQLVGQGKYITHRLGSTSGTDSRSWSFDWTAPAQGTGDVTFYGAFNAANGDGGTSGDDIYTSMLTVSENPSSGLVSAESEKIQVYPNPTSGSFRVQYFLENELQADLLVLDIKGSIVLNRTVNYLELGNGVEINLNEKAGVYFVQLKTEQKAPITKKIIIQ